MFTTSMIAVIVSSTSFYIVKRHYKYRTRSGFKGFGIAILWGSGVGIVLCIIRSAFYIAVGEETTALLSLIATAPGSIFFAFVGAMASSLSVWIKHRLEINRNKSRAKEKKELTEKDIEDRRRAL